MKAITFNTDGYPGFIDIDELAAVMGCADRTVTMIFKGGLQYQCRYAKEEQAKALCQDILNAKFGKPKEEEA